MNNKFWADEMYRLWLEGHSLDEAELKVRKMKEEYRGSKRNGN